ncbi:SH3-domain-containing protein [Xylona heveae TC161]|uniref:SH3-domain-containing protein n=1 Tax=Xylona heveae (strain CBS 132557 / TC161) TaxID=1328760 RepID=A0A164ZCS6_XYLHT|nr:SH3-domain-containing protein [Xylona heveae TC161]KZF18943.1 SH3-domain-containing protein [Xylona heveae TC161]
MSAHEELAKAVTNRTLRTIQTELEFLADSGIITSQTLSSILSQLPSPLQTRATASGTSIEQPTRTPSISAPQPPVAALANTSLNEKQNGYPPPSPSPAAVPPPAYAPPPSAGPPVLSIATALYQYNPTDAGDLAFIPNDRIGIQEYVNPDWWKGRNERTGQEGIFPRTYVRIIEEKAPLPPAPVSSGYGNMPLEVSQSGSTPSDPNNPNKHGKFEDAGKKFGKKLGNAAIFGAGATLGGDIVNSIF